MKIYLGTDHRGFKLKEKIKEWLEEWGVEWEDMGNEVYDPEDDFPDFAKRVAEKVQAGKGKGLLLCGSGGMAMVANKFKGVWAVECWNRETAEHAGEHDDAKVISIPADIVDEEAAKVIIKAWLEAEPRSETMPEKYQRRLDKIKKIEAENFK